MVMRKFLERLETDDNKKLLETLFYDVWCEKLITSVGVTVIYPRSTPVFSLLALISKKITDVSFDDFNKLFMFLKKTNVKFVFKSSQLDITIIDIDNFIKELKQLKDIKSYNL